MKMFKNKNTKVLLASVIAPALIAAVVSGIISWLSLKDEQNFQRAIYKLEKIDETYTLVKDLMAESQKNYTDIKTRYSYLTTKRTFLCEEIKKGYRDDLAFELKNIQKVSESNSPVRSLDKIEKNIRLYLPEIPISQHKIFAQKTTSFYYQYLFTMAYWSNSYEGLCDKNPSWAEGNLKNSADKEFDESFNQALNSQQKIMDFLIEALNLLHPHLFLIEKTINEKDLDKETILVSHYKKMKEMKEKSPSLGSSPNFLNKKQ